MAETHEHVPQAQPRARSLEDLARVGVIDVGSNSVRMVVFDGAARAPAYFFNEKVLAGLGRGVRETGQLHPEGRKRALAALRRFMILAQQMELSHMRAVATAAVREASDGPEFVQQVAAETGLILEVITGEDEARLAAQGVLLGNPQARGLICDIGGSSMEVARISKGQVKDGITTALAPLALGGMKQEERDKTISQNMAVLKDRFPKTGRRLYLIGGSWRAIGRIDMVRAAHPLHVMQHYMMSPMACLKTADWVARQHATSLKDVTPNVSRARLDLLPLAATVLRPLIETLEPSELVISSYGLREGLLYDQMAPELRALDPLLEVAEHMERSALYKDVPKDMRRLVKAAALLHDVAWRAHPDYRAEVCFETVTRANLGSLTHEDRIFLGLALTQRYKSGMPNEMILRLSEELDETARAYAQALGRALRLGAMISGDASAVLARARLVVTKGVLEMHLKQDAAVHAGEVVERRLMSLAASHGLEGRIVVDGP